MTLATVHLFGTVGITRDYSVVHDMTPDEWLSYLLDESRQDNRLTIENVNYNRIQDTLRIEHDYDLVRKMSYGCLELGTPGMRPMFFWVDSCRLIKKNSKEFDNPSAVPLDVVELTLSEDVWSNNSGKFELHDTYVERRHMDRWNENEPVYYSDASQGVDGSYLPESIQNMTPAKETELGDVELKYIVVSALDPKGQLKIYIGCEAKHGGKPVPVYHTYKSRKFFTLKDVLDGSIYGGSEMVPAEGFGITADNVQSITVLPVIAGLTGCLKVFRAGDASYLSFNEIDPRFSGFSFGSGNSRDLGYITLNFGIDNLDKLMQTVYSDVDPWKPNPVRGSTYKEQDEPMLYRAPARVRKIVTGTGGTVIDVPDIDCFRESYGMMNTFDLTGALTFVFGGSDIKEGNAIGNIGTVTAATLPIYNSAWKTYEAINRAGDKQMYNAKQLGMGISALFGAAVTAGGAAVGGKAGGAISAGGGSSVIGNLMGIWQQGEEWDAKMTTLRNSPCTVTSTGSGMGAFVTDTIDFWYMVLKIDDVSYRKLEEQYYFYGYFMNRTERGSVRLRTRQLFDFIKTSRARVRGECNTDALQTIAQIFDSGVTIYHGAEGYEYIGEGMTKANNEVSE